MSLWSLLFDVLVVFFFILLNGFFVAAEFAIVKVRLSQIEPLARKGNWRAKIAQDMLLHTTAYLSATQLGVTMTSLVLGWIGEPITARILLPAFQWIGLTQPQVVEAVSFAVAFGCITALHIVVGEQAPKVLAIQKAPETILMVSSPMRFFFFLFRPIITALNSSSNGLLRLAGVQIPDTAELAHSEEELRSILAHDAQVSVLTKSIALNAMDFHEKQARHAMVPRKEIIALALHAPAAESIAVMRKNKFSRYPVYKDSIDNIIGIVYTKDIFKFDRHLLPEFTLQSVLRDAFFLPETATLEKTLTTILQKRTHMIILADEYGGTAGLVTLENVLEQLVGTIQDEYDREAPDIVKVNEDEFLIDGSVMTSDVERMISVELSIADIRSIGGLLIEQLGHIPVAGERVQWNGIECIAERVVDNAVESVRIKRLPHETETTESGAL